jgi:hypothetical protein
LFLINEDSAALVCAAAFRDEDASAATHINAAKTSLIKLSRSSELFRQRHPLDSLSDTTQTVACLTLKIQLVAFVRVFTHRDWVISLMTKSDANDENDAQDGPSVCSPGCGL